MSKDSEFTKNVPFDKTPVQIQPGSSRDLTYGITDYNGFFEAPAEDAKPLLEYLNAILYRKWLVFGVFILALGIAIFYIHNATPHYVSSATIELEKVYPSSAGVGELFSFFGQFDLYYQTQMESLKSRTLAEKFLEKMKSKDKSGDGQSESEISRSSEAHKASLEEARISILENEKRKAADVNQVISTINVTPIKGTQLIQVEMGASDPMVARDMLKGYLETFIEEDRQKRLQISAKVKAWLQNELSEAEKQLKESEANLLEFSRKHGIVYLSKFSNKAVSLFEKTGEALAQSQDVRVNLESIDPEKAKMLPPQASNEALSALRNQLAQLKSEYTGMKAIYSPNYFKMGLLKNRIKSLEEAIAEIEKESVSAALEAAKKKEELTGEVYEKSKQEAIDMNSLAVQYEILKKLVEANSQAYITLLQKSKQAELDHGLMGHNISIISHPSLPLTPVSPQKTKILLMGAILGLLGGIGLAIAFEYFDSSVQTTYDIEKRLNVPILGAVPRVKNAFSYMDAFRRQTRLDPKISTVEFVAYRFPTAPFTEAVRIVQNTASALLSGPSGSVMCISSALPLEGKTLISVVMSTVIASENKRILLLDGDMRRPRIHQVFKAQRDEIGLSDLITGKCLDIKEAIRKSPVPGLYYMTSGSSVENPVALLKAERMQEIIEACRNAFDFIIIDAPPVLGIVDATILSGYSDGLILVARANHTPLELIRQAKESVFRGQGRLLGIVLNMADGKSNRYGSSTYNYYYYSRKNA